MPGLEPKLKTLDPIALADHPEDANLCLPSALPLTSRDTQCVDGLAELEYLLRHAQASKILHHIRNFLRVMRALVVKKQSHIANTQRTKTRGLNDKVKIKLNEAVSTYRTSRVAIENLAPNEEFGPWKQTLQDLQTDDIRGPGPEGSEPSRSRFVQSWIWTTATQDSTSVEDSDLLAAVRVEWCKLQERAKRYQEEMELDVEEMRRTLVTFERNAQEWDSFATSPPLGASAIEAMAGVGVTAYAFKQADIWRRMINVFADDWYHLLNNLPFGVPWLENFLPPPETKRRRLVSCVQLYRSNPNAPQPDLPECEIVADNVSSALPHAAVDEEA
jgi:hypothetical protein